MSKNLFGKKSGRTERFEVKNPLVIVFRTPDGDNITHLYPPDGWSHQHYGLLVCDLVRHVARAFKVDEAAVWEWVDKERNHLTTAITHPS